MFRDLPDAFFTQDGVPAGLIRAGDPRWARTTPTTDRATRAAAPTRRPFLLGLLRPSSH